MATMLHWLAGAKTADNVNDANAGIDPPETPAPVFAVKAFRHALFGTPPTIQRPQPRRHSTTENRPRNIESPRPTRPRMDRPKSANDANALVPPPASPTKGILMTPGTAAAKKKNVTFGDHVIDNQEKRPLKSGLPDDCPGKFPSPWTKASDGEKDGTTDKGRGRNKLTEALEQARDESRPRRGRMDDGGNYETSTRIPADENECCEYWRREYDVYRTNTQREVKKLVKKYKAAKDYAQSKDDEASDLRLHLQEAETKADALEEAVNLLTAQIKEMEEKLRSQPQPQPQPEAEAEAETLVPPPRQSKERDRPRDLQALLERRGPKERTASAATVRTTENDQLQRPSEPRPTSSRRENQVQRPSEEDSPLEKPKDNKSQRTQPSAAPTAGREIALVTAARRTPAGIAARWAAVKDAPQRPSEPAAIPTKPEAEPAEQRRKPDPTSIPPERTTAAAQSRALSTRPPLPHSENLIPPPGDLHLPSDPAIYTSPPSKQISHPPQPTVEEDTSPPPPPPPHGPQRQDSGSGGTLKPMSANARSGSGGDRGGGSGIGGDGVAGSAGTGGTEIKLGRDGKAIDPARIEAAKARLRGRGREVS